VPSLLERAACRAFFFVGWAGSPAHAVIDIGSDFVRGDLARNYRRVGKKLAHPTVLQDIHFPLILYGMTVVASAVT
jgi:hypothetical protein